MLLGALLAGWPTGTRELMPLHNVEAPAKTTIVIARVRPWAAELYGFLPCLRWGRRANDAVRLLLRMLGLRVRASAGFRPPMRRLHRRNALRYTHSGCSLSGGGGATPRIPRGRGDRRHVRSAWAERLSKLLDLFEQLRHRERIRSARGLLRGYRPPADRRRGEVVACRWDAAHRVGLLSDAHTARWRSGWRNGPQRRRVAAVLRRVRLPPLRPSEDGHVSGFAKRRAAGLARERSG